MENISHFQSLDELIKALDRERKLIQALFQDRKKLSFRVELAKEMASKREDSLDFMRRFGIIREVDDCVELEDVYLKFFEDVLVVNETINVASVRECIEALNDEIDFYLAEQNPNRKASYLKNVKRLLRNINLDTYRNVIDLSRNINNTYKNEPNFAIKKKKLENLDEKRKSIALLINECEKLIDERQITFFTIAMDVQLNQIVSDLKFRFREVYHTLLELNRTIITYLKAALAPRITRHGVLVEVYGEGILLIGDSGIGKSEAAVELLKRGHRLIADDAVEIKKVSTNSLVGTAPELIRNYIELRGIGIINVAKLFGVGAVRSQNEINLVVKIVPWNTQEVYDRLGLEEQYMEILGVNVPMNTIPITPGRNLAMILEVAAMNNRQKKMGYNSAQEFTEQINRYFASNMGNGQ